MDGIRKNLKRPFIFLILIRDKQLKEMFVIQIWLTPNLTMLFEGFYKIIMNYIVGDKTS